MPPKTKVTKEEIALSALELVREEGSDALNARNIAKRLGVSTQPIFSNFKSMEDLRMTVVERADALCSAYMEREAQKGEYPRYKAGGMAYIRFAKEEKELFQLLYMRDRSDEKSKKELSDDAMIKIVQNNTGLDLEGATLFHLEMWAFVHGIATMFATGFLNLEWELVSRMLTDCYQGLRKQNGLE